jgi:hypothetical protein
MSACGPDEKNHGRDFFGEGPTPGKLRKQKICSEMEGEKSRLIWKPIMKIPLIPHLAMPLS